MAQRIEVFELPTFGKLLGLRTDRGKSHLLCCKLLELYYIQTL